MRVARRSERGGGIVSSILCSKACARTVGTGRGGVVDAKRRTCLCRVRRRRVGDLAAGFAALLGPGEVRDGDDEEACQG
jgi:hypothetical protein